MFIHCAAPIDKQGSERKKKGRKEGRREGRKEGRKEGRRKKRTKKRDRNSEREQKKELIIRTTSLLKTTFSSAHCSYSISFVYDCHFHYSLLHLPTFFESVRGTELHSIHRKL